MDENKTKIRVAGISAGMSMFTLGYAYVFGVYMSFANSFVISLLWPFWLGMLLAASLK